MCKNAFLAPETTILPLWLYLQRQKRIFSPWNDDFAVVIVLTAHASVLDVTLMRIYEVSQNFKFSLQKVLFSQYMCT